MAYIDVPSLQTNECTKQSDEFLCQEAEPCPEFER